VNKEDYAEYGEYNGTFRLSGDEFVVHAVQEGKINILVSVVSE
jgi:hypothetical protein